MNRWNLAWLIGIPAFIVFGATFSYIAPISRAQEQDYELIKLIAEVIGEVDASYVRELDPDARRRLVEDMISGGLERLDPHSTYFSDRDFKQFERESKGKFGGIGIQVSLERGPGALFVTSPIAGTPAYEAGIQAGDLIVKVDGVSLDHKRHNESVDLIQGEAGTPVTLSVIHEGDTKAIDITMNRAIIEIETVLGDTRKVDEPKTWDYMLDKEYGIGYVRIAKFDEPTPGDLKNALEQLKKEGARGLVIDLRTNPGGLLPAAVEIADLFLNEGTIVSTRGRGGKPERPYVAKLDGGYFEPAGGHPIVVLVDRYGASASEIVASALQDHHRAIVIGERSFGKGSVQHIVRVGTGKAAIKLTTASYWRPSGKNIHRFPDAKEGDEWGVRPDDSHEIKLTDEERKAYLTGRRARDIVPNKSGAIPEKLREKIEAPFVDKVLDKALEYLRDELRKSKAA